MRKTCLLFFAFVTLAINSFAQADCSSAIIICGNTQSFNPSGIGSKLEQLACGGIEHNTVWLAFQAKASGKLNFVIRPFTPDGLPSASDFDWSLFSLPGAPGVGNCDNKTSLSCNFSGAATVFGIPGGTGMASPPYSGAQFNPGIDVVSGNWYVLIVDQFSNTTPLLFSVQFTGNPESPYLNSTSGIFDNKPDFTINTTSGCSGAYSFTSSSVATSGIGSYLWNFGDGTTSISPAPSHSYVTPGTYYVTLTVTDNNGCKSDIRKQLVFNNTPPVVNTAGILLTPACTDGNNGTITINTIGATTNGVTGGTAPYMFELVSPSPSVRPLQASNTFTGLQPGGYTVKVTDACGKIATNTVTVTQVVTNATITVGVQNTQAACGATPTGTATLSVTATVPPYTLQLVSSSPVTTGVLPTIQRDPVTATYYTTFTNLLPGSYTVEAIDGCGRARRATFIVAASTAPIANAVSSASCPLGATGTLNITPTAATGLSGAGSPGVFQFALIAPSPITRPFQNGSVFENLLPGTYTIAVRDVCGNIGTATSAIANATAPTFGTAFTTPSCPNGATGTVEAQINAVGGGSPYTFELIAPSPVTRAAQASNAFSALPPGTYTIRLTDICGVAAITTFSIAAATAPSFTTTLTASCSTPASGTITVTPGASAISPFSFELIAPGAAIRPAQPSNIANTVNSIFTTLNLGNYTVRMTDGCGVPVTGVATIAAPVALTFPAGSLTIPSCAASSTGMITVATPGNGLGAYKYELIAPSPVIRAAQYSKIFNSLPVGNYTVRITDSCGSQVTIAAPLVVAASTVPALTVTNTSSCVTNTGTITCLATTANQGGGAYQYALIAPSPVTRPNQTSPIFTGLNAGAYTVQITDQCGSIGTTTTTITAAGAFTPAAGGSIVSCAGASYNAQIIVTTPQNFTTGGPIPAGSGGGPYTYAIYDAANTTLIAGPQASNVFSTITPIAGTPTHTVRVTDVCGNTSTVTVTINLPTALVNAAISATTASCAASNTGVIKVTTVATGGLAPYTYSLIDATTLVLLAGPQTGTTFNNVAANATGYFVRTTDACGNTITTTTALLFPAAVVPTATVATVPSCITPATGRITATPGSGATLAGGTFSYSLYDAANTTLIAGPQSSPVFNNVAAAAYTVRITDRCGTVGTVAATVSSTVTALTASGIATGTCSGGNNGVITGAFTGGSLPVTYTLVNQVTSTVVAGPQASNIFAALPAGTYIVRTIDACGTIANSANVVLGNLGTAPTITISVALDCAGSAILGGFGAGGSGGPYTYAICTGAACTTFGAYSTASTFTVTASGTYVISVKDRCGIAISSADIVVNIPAKATITGVTKANACGNTTITVAATGIVGTPYYSVDGANFATIIPTLIPGCHTVRVADNNAGTFGCASDVFDVSVFDVPTLTAPSLAQVNCSSGLVQIPTSAGNTGCAGSGAALGVKLISCTGCTVDALLINPIGTIKSTPTPTFTLGGATQASFAPVVSVTGTEICSGSSLVLNFATTYCGGLPLPIKIEYFTGSNKSNGHLLEWKVVPVNTPNGKMILEQSGDNINFNTVASITATAIEMLQPFSYLNYKPLNGINYYRLKLIDDNGSISYSNIIILSSNIKGFEMISIVPNPVTEGKFKLNITAAKKVKIEIIITDMAGRKIQNKLYNINYGLNQIDINVSNLAKGIYQIFAITPDNDKTKTLSFNKQ